MQALEDKAMLGASKYSRFEHDFYETESWCVEALLRNTSFSKHVWEPACGRGAITRVLEAFGHDVYETDIHDHGHDADRRVDFLTVPSSEDGPQKGRDIVTNPPYGRDAERFIRHALTFGTRVAMLMRHEYDCAASRVDLFNCAPFAMKIVLTKRPRWIEGSKGSPRHNYAWYVWDWSHRGPATIIYDERP